MYQLLQSLKDGSIAVVDAPPPQLRTNFVHVRNEASLLSPGTDRLTTELASKGLLAKARSRPDLVRKVLDKARRDGWSAALQSVRARLEEPASPGYSCAGRVIAAGRGAETFRPGMLVACAGAGYASHAEEVCVPRQLTVPVPDGVSAEDAAFTTLGAIALQGVRITRPEIGESVVVIGLGLLGQLTVQILNAAGCIVFGTDPDPTRVELAREHGLAAGWARNTEGIAERIREATGGHGADAVVVAASCDNNDPLVLGGEVCRERGRVTVVGAVRTEFDRNAYYAKELEVRLSRSYGPGRYDPSFEERGLAYPRAYVRFTETENMRSFLDLVAQRRVDLSRLVTHRFPIAEAPAAYSLLLEGREPSLGIVIGYEGAAREQAPVQRAAPPTPAGTARPDGRPAVSFLGAGSFARSVLIPAFSQRTHLRALATGRGFTAAAAGERHGFDKVLEDAEAVLADEATDWVVVATRHDRHAELSARALEAGKHVFCEKPLALDGAGLAAVESALASSSGLLHVGFNRRFAPLVVRLMELRSESVRPAILSIRVDAGALPPDHWNSDPEEGGGRMLGEGCHFVDLARAIVGSPIRAVQVGAASGSDVHPSENFSATLEFEDGSVATIVYTSLGDPAAGKERIELFAGGVTAHLDDYGSLTVTRGGRTQKVRSRVRDKGHTTQIDRLVAAWRAGGPAPIPVDELLEVSRAVLALPISMRTGKRVELSELEALLTSEQAATDAVLHTPAPVDDPTPVDSSGPTRVQRK